MYHLNQCKVNRRINRRMRADYSWNWKEFRPKAGQADKRAQDRHCIQRGSQMK